ncbi:Autophagy-related protein 17 [Drechmeria coniospora]|uniref:Autophagy-related protein 17 n=1 Tax=Drechmeria coniospora TaxID=98403 RepID=A0A151GH66_DRECN|nr:Autophagy-related protein 17 [Drechmeria coniospora]KYK56453.1 Autophagy-related protein 17 [Drechmeria coniospora]ODA76899.1 hypothetical protein RJ55_07415 [Drechmeria coniospora]
MAGTTSSTDSLPQADDEPKSPIPLDTLVNHLLVSKRSLSSMNLVLRANELATAARRAHEDTLMLVAQTTFIRAAIVDQISILVRVRRSLNATCEWGQRDFKRLIRAMDDVNHHLAATMSMLKTTTVQADLRPPGESRRSLLDFVDESGVHSTREVMKASIQQLQAIQRSLDGDLLRFETDIRALKQAINQSTPPADDGRGEGRPMVDVLIGMDENSSAMAQLLTSLTKHFDMCVTAIRTTEGAAALARRKVAESQGNDVVSISGVIAEQESHMSNLEPKTAKDREEMFKVVLQDAKEVDDVVGEIHDRLAAMESDHDLLQEEAKKAETASAVVMSAFSTLRDVGDRLANYLAAEGDFLQRWGHEKEAIFDRIREMKDMRTFYEGYSSAYAGLVLEVDRRRAVDKQIEDCWRRAQSSVDKLLEADGAARKSFHHHVGEFLPTDLWVGVQDTPKTWKVVVDTSKEADAAAEDQR